MTQKTVRERHLYSVPFREQYGRSLTREEIRLVQGYRGLSAPKQAALLTLVSSMLDGAREAENATPDYVWKCDESAVTKPKGGAHAD
jgi:hypothetical protein